MEHCSLNSNASGLNHKLWYFLFQAFPSLEYTFVTASMLVFGNLLSPVPHLELKVYPKPDSYKCLIKPRLSFGCSCTPHPCYVNGLSVLVGIVFSFCFYQGTRILYAALIRSFNLENGYSTIRFSDFGYQLGTEVSVSMILLVCRGHYLNPAEVKCHLCLENVI